MTPELRGALFRMLLADAREAQDALRLRARWRDHLVKVRARGPEVRAAEADVVEAQADFLHLRQTIVRVIQRGDG